MYNLLLVDDETEILTFLERLCEGIHEFEKRIYKANSGKKVLSLLETTAVDVVVSDIRMPGMNGLELCEAIRAKAPHCKIIFLTGYRDFDAVYKAVQKGDIRYLMKTENDDTIREAIISAFGELEQEHWNEKVLENSRFHTPRFSSSSPEQSRADKEIHIVTTYISAHLGEDLTLTTLADVAHLNASYLSRLFKQKMGVTVSAYILDMRIEAAKDMLVSTNKKIFDIALSVGYQSGHSFSRLFHKVTGMSPQNFRISMT